MGIGASTFSTLAASNTEAAKVRAAAKERVELDKNQKQADLAKERMDAKTKEQEAQRAHTLQMVQLHSDAQNNMLTAMTSALAPRKDPFQAIKDLKELLEIGAITQDEFEQKKKEQLAKI